MYRFKMGKKIKGMGVLELLMVLTIITLLSVLSLKQYKHYVDKEKYDIAISNLSVYKIAVNLCFNAKKDLTACNSGTNGIPIATTSKENSIIQNINKINVVSGIIHVEFDIPERNSKKLMTADFIPNTSNEMLKWVMACSDYGDKTYADNCAYKKN